MAIRIILEIEEDLIIEVIKDLEIINEEVFKESHNLTNKNSKLIYL